MFISLQLACVGDARLAKNVNNKVYSIDLVASDPSVIACDMAKVSLSISSDSDYSYCFWFRISYLF